MAKILRFLENMNRYARSRWNHDRLSDRFSGYGKTRRRFHRHSLHGLKGCFLLFDNKIYPLVNISYSGAAILAREESFCQIYRFRKQVNCVVSVLGISCPARIGVLYVSKETVGITFVDDDSPIHKFLEKTIYYLDCGLVLRGISRNSVSHFFQGPSWNSYGNENISTEIHIKFSLDGSLEQVNVSFINGIRREYVVFSAKAMTVSTVPEKKLSVAEKKFILRNTILIIVGFRQIGNTDRFDSLILAGIGLLKKNH